MELGSISELPTQIPEFEINNRIGHGICMRYLHRLSPADVIWHTGSAQTHEVHRPRVRTHTPTGFSARPTGRCLQCIRCSTMWPPWSVQTREVAQAADWSSAKRFCPVDRPFVRGHATASTILQWWSNILCSAPPPYYDMFLITSWPSYNAHTSA